MSNQNNLVKNAFSSCSSNLLIVIFFSFFINILMFVAPLHMLQMYDRVLVSRNEVTLLVLTGLALGLLVVYGILEAVRSRILVRLSLRFDELVSHEMFDVTFESTLKHPRVATPQALRDVDMLRDFISGGAVIAFCDAPWVPLFISACFILHPLLGFVALGGAVLVFCLAALNEWLTRKKISKANQLSIQGTNYAVASLQNAEVVKALGMVEGVRGAWAKNRDSMLADQASASDVAGSILASSRFIRMGLQVTILATGAYLAVQDLISPGMMIAASIIMGRALAPVELAVSQWRNFVAARDAYLRLRTLTDLLPPKKDKMDLPPPTGEVEIQGAFIRPPDTESTVISNLSMSFSPGTITGIVGPSGSGKSTLVRAIVGVWPLVRGAVRFSGANVDNWKSENLGPYIGYMPQDVELFRGTVAQNIARFQTISPEDVVVAAKKAGVHELILELPSGYDTNIGDGGHVLSGGERQRLALARAMYKSPKILVLDEPNSNLDAAGEKALADTLLGAKRDGATVIVISHRPSLLAHTDKIAVLNKGILMKFGDRQNVLAELGAPAAANPAGLQPANN